MAQWVIKSTSCSCRQPGFNSQHPYDGLQPSLTPVLGDQWPPQVLGMHMVHIYLSSQSIHTHKS